MPTAKEIQELATELHDKKIINLDISGREFLLLQSPVLNSGPETEAGWYVLAGDHFVIVCGTAAAGKVVNPAEIPGVRSR